MASLVINILLGAFLILFAAMAILPMLLDNGKPAARKSTHTEDRVLRLEHRAILERRHGRQEPVIVPVPPIGDRPVHRTAA